MTVHPVASLGVVEGHMRLRECFVGDLGVDVSMLLKQILETGGAGTWARIGSNGRFL
jgi:hypothetical protein